MVSYNILLVYDSELRDEVVSDWIAGGLCESTLVKYQKGWGLWTQHIEAEGHGTNRYLYKVDRGGFIKDEFLFIRGVSRGSKGNMKGMETAMSGVGRSALRRLSTVLTFSPFLWPHLVISCNSAGVP